jgi:hypothetical protein
VVALDEDAVGRISGQFNGRGMVGRAPNFSV